VLEKWGIEKPGSWRAVTITQFLHCSSKPLPQKANARRRSNEIGAPAVRDQCSLWSDRLAVSPDAPAIRSQAGIWTETLRRAILLSRRTGKFSSSSYSQAGSRWVSHSPIVAAVVKRRLTCSKINQPRCDQRRHKSIWLKDAKRKATRAEAKASARTFETNSVKPSKHKTKHGELL
jgi:hypothetical protein